MALSIIFTRKITFEVGMTIFIKKRLFNEAKNLFETCYFFLSGILNEISNY